MGVTICKECKFALGVGDPDPLKLSGHCLNPDVPVSEFVHGFKYCGDINKGHCKFFEVYTGAT